MAKTLINGVASGDTTQRSTVLWTRSTAIGKVTFEYALDPKFRNVVGKAKAKVTDPLVPVKVEIDQLAPATDYFYRVTDAAGDTAVGQFRTSTPKRFYRGLHFGVSGDWQGELSPYPSISNVDQKDLDFFVQLGDTIEADSESPALPGVTQAKTLEEFRTKHAEIYTTRFGRNPWAALRSSTTTYATWDDHDVTNDFAGGAAPTVSPQKQGIFGTEGDFVNQTTAFKDALKAFQDYKPLRDEFYGDTGDPRTANAQKLYRANQFGKDAAMFTLDLRSFRDTPLPFISEAAPADQVEQYLQDAFNPDRTLLGEAQLEELKSDLLAAQSAGTTWKFVMSTVPIQNFGIAVAGERWEGFAAERAELLGFIEDNDIENVVFVTGDFHGSVVNNVTYQEGFGEPQISTGVVDIMMGPVGIQLTVPFLPPPFNETFAAPFGVATVGFTPASLLDAQGKSQAEYLALTDRAEKDQYVREILDARTTPLGYDPVGLEGSGLDAKLLKGEYIAAHTYGWTEFEIAPRTQRLIVTVYGIEPYMQADLEADPEAIAGQEPFVVSRFALNPVDFSPSRLALLGTPDDDRLRGTDGSDRLLGVAGKDKLIGGNKADRLAGGRGNDVLNGGGGNDRLVGDVGNDQLLGRSGRNDLIGGKGKDTFFLHQDGVSIVKDFNAKSDRFSLGGKLKFDDLEIVDRGKTTRIQFKDETIALLPGVEAIALTEDLFV